MDKFTSLINRFKTIIANYNKIDRLSGEKFNLFEILNLQSEEVRVHSAMLAELLNPKGSHGLGVCFLELFLKQMNISEFHAESAKVETEKHIGPITGNGCDARGGNLDLYIADEKGRTIIIENKIYAGDQADQIQRYYNYNKDNVIYLTLDGCEPGKGSCGDLKAGTDFKLMSYKEDVKSWLESCQKEACMHPMVMYGINHYVILIKHLTNQSTNTNMKNELRDLLLESPENLQVAISMTETLVDVKIRIQELFFESLIAKIEEQGYEIYNKDNFERSLLSEIKAYYWARSRNYYGLPVKVSNDDLPVLWYFGMGDDNLCHGFTYDSEKLDSVLKDNLINALKEFNANYKSNQYWLGWVDSLPLINFKNLNDQSVALVDKSKREEIVTRLVDEMKQNIEFMRSKLSESGL